MDTIEIKGQGDQTTIAVQTALNNTLFAKRTLAHDAMGVKFMQWLREIPEDVRTKLLAAIYIEYALAAHINMRNEEDALADLNMHEESVSDIVVESMLIMAEQSETKQVSLRELGEHMEKIHLAVPPQFLYGFVKGLESYHGDFDVAVGDEGYVTVKDVK